jgi:hypothetical protein
LAEYTLNTQVASLRNRGKSPGIQAVKLCLFVEAAAVRSQ